MGIQLHEFLCGMSRVTQVSFDNSTWFLFHDFINIDIFKQDDYEDLL